MSLLKAIKAQLGLSNTPANNFTITAEADNGSLKVARRNAGATTQDILTVDANGRVAMPNNVVAFKAYATGATSITSSANKIALAGKHFDTTNAFDSVTNYRFTPTVAGYYQINGWVSSVTGSYQILPYLYKNGSAYVEGNSPSTGNRATVQDIVYMNGTTDYIELYCYSGTTQNTAGAALSGILIAKA